MKPCLILILILLGVETMAIDKIWFDERWGMNLHPGPHVMNDNENGVLFMAENFIFKEAKGILTKEDIDFYAKTVKNLETYGKDGVTRIKGMYDKAANDSIVYKPRERIAVITHDNITAISAFSKRHNLPFAKDINHYGMRNFFILDNIQPWAPRFERIQWWSDVSFWMFCGNNPLYLLFYPVLFVRTFLSISTEPDNVSMKSLIFTKLYLTKDKGILMKLLWKGFRIRMRSQYGKFWVHELMKRYFKDPNHPNILDSQGLEL